jgi:hypothetical protein
MRRLTFPIGAALVGLVVLGLVAGDPRATSDVEASWRITLAGSLLAVLVGLFAWYGGRRRSWWLAPPTVFLALMGGLIGWISAAEFTHQPDTAVRLATQPGRAAFMVALTAAGMVLPSVGLAALAGIRRPGRART